MATRTITGTILRSDGSPWAGATVRFQLLDDTYTASPAQTLPISPIEVATDSSGSCTVVLVSGLDQNYLVTLPDGSTFEITVPAGSATTLETLRAATFGTPTPNSSVETALLAIYGTPPIGRAAVAVQEGDVTVVTEAAYLDFDASDFNVTESPAGEANISLAYGTSAGTPAEGNHAHPAGALDSLSDVVITAAATGEIVRYDGSNWVDSAFRVLTGSATWDPASLGTGQIDATTVTVTGLAAGDPCFAGHANVATTNLTLHAIGDATNSARVVLHNTTGGTVNIASGTVRVVCFAGV